MDLGLEKVRTAAGSDNMELVSEKVRTAAGSDKHGLRIRESKNDRWF